MKPVKPKKKVPLSKKPVNSNVKKRSFSDIDVSVFSSPVG